MNFTEMQLTKEQQDIIHSSGNIRINAVAGSGKTTTVIEYAKTRPAGSRILYLAFNKSVKLEAVKKFADKGLRNVTVETAHSLAYRNVVFRSNYKVRSQGYRTNEIAEMLHLEGNGEKHAEYIVANHINKFIAYFCNSDQQKVQQLNYLDVVSDPKAASFVKTFYKYIEAKARLLLDKMNRAEIEITHDFYLKKFQLSNPILPYDYILFDEGQDASPAMLDIFLKQPATKVIVGDTHQQIYGWRYAVNSLEKVDFATFHLSTSFRFAQPIANLAMQMLQFKNKLGDFTPIPITGMGKSEAEKTKAVLARTNLGLLLKAIEYVTEKKELQGIYFEGNINSYTYADEGASLYDVLSLYNNNHRMIKDKLIAAMNNIEELEEYVEKTEDAQLGMMIDIVKEYGNEIPGIIKKIKDKHISNDEKENAQMVFSTVHRCKGMEYDAIQLVNDFITEEKLEKLMQDKKMKGGSLAKLNEEINLLYVAVTRARNLINIPEALMPKEFPVCPQIKVLKSVEPDAESSEESNRVMVAKAGPVKAKAYTVADVRKGNKDACLPWTDKLDNELTQLYCEGTNLKDLSNHFGRTKGAIIARIKKLELKDIYG